MSVDSSSESRYPIHLAAGSGTAGTVTELIRYGANIESLAEYDQTPLHKAATY